MEEEPILPLVSFGQLECNRYMAQDILDRKDPFNLYAIQVLLKVQPC